MSSALKAPVVAGVLANEAGVSCGRSDFVVHFHYSRYNSMDRPFEFNDNSLCRHGISRIEAVEVVENEQSEYFPLSRQSGNDRLMFVGYSAGSSTLLEVGVEFLPGDKERIFHANKDRKYFQNLFFQRKHK
jgi:hypothetical protein